MHLLEINRNKTKTTNMLKMIYLKNLLKKKKEQLNFFTYLKKIKKYKSLRLFLNSKILKFRFKSITKYVIGISIFSTNLVIYFSNIKGKIIFFCSAGFLGIKKKQRKKKIVILKKLMKLLISKINHASNNFTVALHLKNFNCVLGSFVSSFLSKYYNINSVKINNNKSYNGCRPRKIKRKKRKKLSF